MEAAVKPYPLDNNHPKSADHHASLTSLFDPYSQQRASELVKLRGASCLEVGYGGGGFALWLAGEVGPDGSVLATDLAPREIPEHPRLTVLQHDIINEPVPGTFDLIHARLVLGHLPQQRQILTRLAEALKPGGVLFIEDWWTATPGDLVVHAPDEESAELYNQYSMVARQVFGASGTDRNWARRMHGAMMDDGLVDVHTDIHAEAWAGGSAGSNLLQATMPQLREKLRAAGLTDDVLERVRALLDDPRLVLTGHLMCSTSGRKPS
jgi:SAM-dependent methyltransferase